MTMFPERYSGDRLVLRNVSVDRLDEILLFGPDGGRISPRDPLTGTSGDDYLVGGSGDDRLEAGSGTDRLWGKEGADTFAFSTENDLNIIYDFNVTEDSLDLDLLLQSHLTAREYAGRDLDLRWQEGTRIVMRDVNISDLDLIDIVGTDATLSSYMDVI